MVSARRDRQPATKFITATTAMLRTCPRCGAKPNKMCFRTIAGAEYEKPLKNVHKERKEHRPPKDQQ